MPTLKIVLSGFVCLLFAIVPLHSADAQSDSAYTVTDLAPNVARLLQSGSEGAFFIVGVAGTPDFIQMYSTNGSAFLDFPMITQRQKSLRPELEKVCEELGLALTVTQAGNGLEFLDYDLPHTAPEIGEIVTILLMRVYSVDREAVLEFEANGFDLTAT